jgi:NADH:ubiquinone oxidoreductase subunit
LERAFRQWESKWSNPSQECSLSTPISVLLAAKNRIDPKLSTNVDSEVEKRRSMMKGIVTAPTSDAINNLCEEKVLKGILAAKDSSGQGTSQLEAVNKLLGTSSTAWTSRMTFQTAQQTIGIILMKHNWKQRHTESVINQPVLVQPQGFIYFPNAEAHEITLLDVVKSGFIPLSDVHHWTEEEVQKLDDTLLRIVNRTSIVTVSEKNWIYWIHHHVFFGSITKEAVKKKLAEYRDSKPSSTQITINRPKASTQKSTSEHFDTKEISSTVRGRRINKPKAIFGENFIT